MFKYLLPLVVLLLSACSEQPNDSDIVSIFTKHHSAADFYIIENIEKLNGFKESENKYIADIKYRVVFTKSLNEFKRDLEAQNKASDNPINQMAFRMIIMTLKMEYGDFEAGNNVEKEEKVVFLKTDNGWQIEK